MDDEKKLEALSAKREEIAAYIATALGMGPWVDLPVSDRERIDDEADDAISAWSEAEHDDVPPVPATGDLQQLLKEYRKIEESVLDARDGRLTSDDKDLGLNDEA